MMKKTAMRAFAAGILFSVIVLLSYQYFFGKETAAIKDPSIHTSAQKEMKSLKKQVNEWKGKYDTLLKERDELQEVDEITSVFKYHLLITTGMNSSDISELLAKAKIIEDADAFNKFLGEKNYHHKIQIGEYELTSEMSMEEIADMIIGKKAE